jgi:hypothetical protein
MCLKKKFRVFFLCVSDHYPGLVHQPDSLDDLDSDTIPFDNIPVRYESTGKYEWGSGGRIS